MTWITDDTGTRWVEYPARKQRNAPRALRFADLKVGDQLVQKPNGGWYRAIPIYYQVTDLWFDPVAGQTDPIKGQMVGYDQIGTNGELRGAKRATTIRGLASQQFEYADIDYIAQCKVVKEAKADGKVVGIGMGRIIRKRPKVAGSTF